VEVAEIENGDEHYLIELQAEIAEQECVFCDVQEQSVDFDLQKQKHGFHEAAIKESKRVMGVRKHSTTPKLFALKDKIILLIHKCAKFNY
jgi:hypothetical protein